MKREIKSPVRSRRKSKQNLTPEQAVWNRRGSARRIRFGSYHAGMTAIAAAAAILVNLIAAEVPSRYTQIDTSGLQLSVLSDQTVEFLQGLTEDITLYYIVQDSTEDAYVARLLERYDDLSDHLTVEKKDPVQYPKFTSQYTQETLTDNSIIAVCGEKSRIISYNDMYETEFNYNYYSYDTTGFDAEGQITSALAALEAEKTPRIYTLTGHGELTFGDSMKTSIEKENIEIDSLNLVTAEEVPEDADCLMLLSPTSDLSNEEAEKILDYLGSGGKAVIISDYTGIDMPNLDSVMEQYGLELADGVVMEGDSSYYVQVPYYVVPDINSTEVSDDLAGKRYVLLAAAQGIQTSDEVRDEVEITPVLTTSDQAYSKLEIEQMTTYNKEEGDLDGPFDLGVIVTETVELEENEASEIETAGAETESSEETTETDAAIDSVRAAQTAQTKLAVFTSSALLDESADQMVSGGNSSLFLNTVSWMCGQSVSVSIPAKSLTMDYLTVTAASGNFWSIVVTGIIPGFCLLCGLTIWLRRRKR